MPGIWWFSGSNKAFFATEANCPYWSPLHFLYTCTCRKHSAQMGTPRPHVHLFSSYYHVVSILANIICKKKNPSHPCISPKKRLISQAPTGFALRPPVSDAVTPVFTSLPGTVLTHPLQPGCLARAWGGKHWGVFDTQLYVEKPCGQYHTVILGEGFLDRVTILERINANPSFI